MNVRAGRILYSLTLSGLLVILILMGVTRLLFAFSDHYRSHLQTWISVALDQPLTFARVQGGWRGFYPTLLLHDVRFPEADNQVSVLAHFKKLRLTLDPYASALTGTLRLREVSVYGVRLRITQAHNGDIAIDGLGRTDAEHGHAAILQRLLAQRTFKLLESSLQWQGPSDHAPLIFNDVNALMQGADGRQRVSLHARIREGGRIALALRLRTASAQSWEGELYVKADRLPPFSLIGGELPLTTIAQSNGELWSVWRGNRLHRLAGDMRLRDVRIGGSARVAGSADASAPAFLEQASGRWHWRRIQTGWQVTAEHIELKRTNELWPPAQLTAQLVQDKRSGHKHMHSAISFLRLDDAAALAHALLPAAHPWAIALADLNPRGEARHIYFRHSRSDKTDITTYALAAEFNNLGVDAWRRMPAIAGMDGRLQMTESSGRLSLASRDAELTFAGLFRAPLNLQQAQGRIDWRRYADHWRVESNDLRMRNADLVTHSRARIDIPIQRDIPPFLDLFTVFDNGFSQTAQRYFPVGIMRPSVVAWLDRALVSGRVNKGAFLFHGRAGDFPFDRGRGHFQVHFDLTNGVLDYLRDWPRIEAIDARVRFDNRGLSITGRSGKIFAAAIRNVQVSIANLRHAKLHVHGEAEGQAEDLLRFIHNSPLRARYGEYLSAVEVKGALPLSLELQLPLYDLSLPHEVAGTIEFRDAQLTFPRWQTRLTHVNGPLRFTESALTAEAIQARLYDQDLSISAHSEAAAAVFTVQGILNSAKLDRHAASSGKYLRGEAEFTSQLRIPGVAAQDKTIALTLHSDLSGLAVNLPAPFTKTRAEATPLSARLEFPPHDQARLTVRYADLLSAALRLEKTDDKFAIKSGALQLGGGIANFPPTPGLSVSGHLQQLSIDDWQAVLSTGNRTSVNASLLPITDMDLQLHELGLAGRRFHNVRIDAKRQPTAWEATIDSKELAGLLHIPLSGDKAVVMSLQRLHLLPVTSVKNEQRTDPRILPPLRISASDFRYGDASFGALQLITRPTKDGMRIENLALNSDMLRVQARGQWQMHDQQSHSDFQFQLAGPRLGDVMTKFGYQGEIAGGALQARIHARWPDAPGSFKLAQLSGSLHTEIGQGRLLDVKPGAAGRVFGLINLNELQRRLRLDFKDLFRKGFSFNEIKGDFRIVSGDAYTENLTLSGPGATILVTGRTGLAGKDYDQKVTVTPHISSSLPIAGAIAHPGLGAALFITQQLFRNQIDNITRYQYLVKGTWENPKIERIPELSREAPTKRLPQEGG